MLDKEKLINMLGLMYKIRFFEERAKKLYKASMLAGNSLGALHSCIGEEAVAVGVCSALRKDDYVLSTHRGHGHCIAKGGDLKRILAELHGKETGYSKGRGGSMHLFDLDIGFLGGNGIVGGGLPIALGSAFSSQYRGKKQVTICFFGDGAATQGTFHESLNIAALWKLPVIFICENNLYAVTTPVSETISIPNIGGRACAYGMPGKTIDGNDILLVYETAIEAVDRARSGGGPALIECKTYRWDPHCFVLPETRRESEIRDWKNREPIARFEKILLDKGIITREKLKKMKLNITEEIDEAEKFAITSPCPDVEEFRREICEK